MISVRKSIATRLALGYGLLVALSILVASAVFYFGTIGVLDRSIDGKIAAISGRLAEAYQDRPLAELAQEIDRQLTDGIDSDTEIFLVVSSAGETLAGNLSAPPDPRTPPEELLTRQVMRYGQPSPGRIMVRRLAQGGTLVVGRDLREQGAIRDLVLRALGAGWVVSLVLVVFGALVFRRQIERRIGEIRRTAHEIEAGDLSRRIQATGDDEFGRLSVDINRMLDRIEHLMDGVRHVSNAIAHDLRTPLGRIRSRLEETLRSEGAGAAQLTEAAYGAIEGIDDLILVFDKLLQIAEAESGMRTASFAMVDLGRIAQDMVELYDAAAEEKGVELRLAGEQEALTTGDRDLLASAVASLIDNAIKYAGPGARVEVGAQADTDGVSLLVRDDGPGIPAAELPMVTQRFYRLDRSRNLPGNGLGLAIVSAIAALHGGELRLGSARPGLECRIVLPRAGAASPSRH